MKNFEELVSLLITSKLGNFGPIWAHDSALQPQQTLEDIPKTSVICRRHT